MADLIALHWGPDEIIAAVPARGRDVRAASLGTPPARDDAAAVGRWLKTELAAKRLSAKRAVLVLPRSAAVFRKLTLPDVPEGELPDLVRMQAATKCPTPLDRLRLDFVPLPRRGETRDALLATVPIKTAEDALAALRAAGFEPAGVGLSSFGAAARLASGDASTLIVAVYGASVEITLVREGAVVLSHSSELQGGDLEEDRRWLPGEVTRAVIAADHLAAGAGITRVVLVGPGDLLEPLVSTFAERYGGRVDLIDEPGKLDVTSADQGIALAPLAAVAGQLEAGGPPRLDFLNPRKRVDKPDRRRLQASLAGAGIAAVALVAYFLSWSTQNELAADEADLQTQKTDLAALLKRGEPTLASHRKLNDWLGDRTDWVSQLSSLDAALPGTDRAYLTKLVLESNQRLGSAATPTLGKVTAEGRARNRFDVQGLNGELSQAGYHVAPKPILESQRDPQYPATFSLDLTIPRPKPTGAAASPSDSRRPSA